MLSTEFRPSQIGLTSTDGEPVSDPDCPVVEAMKTQTRVVADYRIVGRSGREIDVALNVIPIVIAEQARGAVILLQDLSAKLDMKRQLTELYQACSIDALTGVSNRADFERTLREYAKAHRSADASCSIILCDIDYFKKINDTYGHHIGDQALVNFAQILNEHTRSRDVVARYGGEEFVILCASCELQSAFERAEEIRASLASTPQKVLDGKAISASFGVAEFRMDEDIWEFFVRADQALYAAKQNGRNRVEIASDSTEPLTVIDRAIEKQSKASCTNWKPLKGKFLYCEEFRTTTPYTCLLYTSPSPRDRQKSRMPSSA